MSPTATRGEASRVGVRDRFEGRRLANERRQGLQRLRWVLGLAGVTSLAVGVLAFVNSSWFDVDEIEVVGNTRAESIDIVAASGIEPGQGLLDVDLEDARRGVELVPWVGTASVTRSWGGLIAIEVTERGPAAVIPTGDGFALVDHHGRQLEIVADRPSGHLPIRGIEGSGVAGQPAPTEILAVIALIDALAPPVLERVEAVAVDDGDIALELLAGGRVLLGQGSQLGAKVQALETIVARVDLSCLDTIDLRVPETPVVSRTAELEPLGPVTAEGSGEGDPAAPTEEPDSVPLDC